MRSPFHDFNAIPSVYLTDPNPYETIPQINGTDSISRRSQVSFTDRQDQARNAIAFNTLSSVYLTNTIGFNRPDPYLEPVNDMDPIIPVSDETDSIPSNSPMQYLNTLEPYPVGINPNNLPSVYLNR